MALHLNVLSYYQMYKFKTHHLLYYACSHYLLIYIVSDIYANNVVSIEMVE